MARKAGNGEGSVYQRKDGAWVAAVTIGYDDKGKAERRTLYAKTRKEAVEKRDKLRAEVAGGIVAGKNGVTVETLIAEYLAHKAPTWRPASLTSAKSVTANYITKPLGKVKLTNLDTRRVMLWARQQGASRSMQMARAHLHAACRLAVQWGWLGRNPVESTEPVSIEKKKPPELSAEQIRAIIEATQKPGAPPVADVVAVLLGLGLRISEALGLKWEDWDEAKGQIHIKAQLAKVEGKYVLAPLKTKSATRTLAVPVFVAQALQRRRERGLTSPMGLVFTTSVSTPCSLDNINDDLKAWMRREAGLEGLTCHTLRHLHGSYLLDRGVPITVVSAVLGHANPGVTMSVYAHKLKGSHEQVAAVMDGLLEG